MRFERVEYESFSKDMRKWLPVMKDARDSYLAKILNMVALPRRRGARGNLASAGICKVKHRNRKRRQHTQWNGDH